MLKGIFGTNDNGSELSSGSKRKTKKRDGSEEEDSQISRRSRTDSTGTSSTSKRKSSRRESTEQSSGFHPTSTAFSSTSRSPYADVAAPSVASSYATAYNEPANAPIQRPEVVRNESVADKMSRSEKSSRSRRDGNRDSRGDTSRSIDDDDERRNAGHSDTSRRDSRRKPSRKDTATRAAEEHDNSLAQNQFPGQEPAGFGVASPYRPPGLASDYYGDHGESISEQPGVRTDRPSILISADQAHLLEPTIEAHPPPEPSSLGHLGAAAEFFGGEIVAEPMTNIASSRPGKENSNRPGRRPSLKAPGKDSTAHGASPRSSPGPDPRRRPVPQNQNSSSIGMMGAGAAPLAAGAMAAGVGAAADYYTGNIAITPHDQPLPSGIPGRPDEVILGSGGPYGSSAAGSQSQSYYTTSENMQTTSSTITSSSRPPRPAQSTGSNMPLYGAAAAAAGVAGAAYLAHEHTSAQHEQAFSQSPTDYQGRPSDMRFRPGQNQTQAFGPQQQQQTRRRRTGAFGKFVDWFQDPVAVAEYEAYTEAIGVCKYCFEPGTTPAEAPRKHYYRRRRPSSGSRHGSSTRVDKLTRYSSDENLRRRKSKKGYSTTEKVLATGLAGVGAASVANEVYKHRNDFNDTYSIKSGRPDNRSRVSFQENEGERYSTSKRTSRRESEGLSRRESDRRRQSGSEGEVRYEKGSSRRRDSSGSDNRTTSRGGNLSTPVALAGAAAVGAALTSSGTRRRSRSRSKSPKKNRKGHYSKRVSPKHSYVDLNQTLQNTPSGPLGLGAFFSSPSSNSKRGKKKKGLFNFSNNSSSSSDADLVFGEGTVRRKDKRGRRDDRKEDGRQSGMGDTAAILGLAATGAALAAEASRRDDKGKRKEDRRTDSNRYDDDRDRRSRRDDRRDSTNKTKMQRYQDSVDNGDEGAWEDASDDDRSSVDMGLAYGGRLSSRASKESLNEGTNILGWRFGGNQKKREEEKRVRRQSSKPDLYGHDPVKTGLVAGAAGLAGAAAANHYSRPSTIESPPKDMPPLRFVDPVPLDSSEQTPRKQSSVSPTPFPPPMTRTSEASLEHPQPVTLISKDVYQGRPAYPEGPSGPVVFDKPRRDSRGQETGILGAAGTTVAVGVAAVAINDAEHERNRRSAKIPTVVPSLKDGVSFDLTKEQEDREQRRERKRREKEARRAAEAGSTARDAIPKASIITGPERSPERKLETWRLRDAVKAGGPGSMEPPVREPSPQSSTKDITGVIAQPLPTPEREMRLSEIDRQLEELYAQHREQETRKKKEIEAAGLAAAGVAVGAGVIAATSESPSKSEDKPRRKSSLRKSSKYRDQDVETESAVSTRSAPSASASDAGTESAAERLARKAARRVQNQKAPSPVHQHDDYTTFFVPPELKDRMAEHNRESEVNDAKIVDIVPGMRRAETFPDELYHAYGTEDSDIPPTKLPWKVPMLGLVSPTPPPRSPSITAEKSPVILATSGSKDIGEPEIEDVDPQDIEPQRSNSKVTWGDHEINVYEVITPEYERDGHDFTTSSPEITAKKELPSSPLRQAFTADNVAASRDKDMDQPVPPVEKMTTEQREHVALGKDFADLPPSRDITRDMPETTPLVEEREPSSAKSTPAMQSEQFNPAGSTTSNASFYQSPFASTVSDLDLPITSSSSRVAVDGMGDIAESSKEDISEERVSKSERRRRERAEAAAEAETVMPQTKDMAEPHIPGGFDDAPSNVNVFDYMVTTNGSILPSASVLGAAATSVLNSDVGKGKEPEPITTSTTRDLPASEEPEFAPPRRTETFDESAFVDSFATPKRADTFDEGALIDSFATPKRAETFAEGAFNTPKSTTVTSDPEDWEKSQVSSSSGKKSSKSKKSRDDDDYYASSKSSSSLKKKSKRDSQVFNDIDDDAKSTISSTSDPSRSKSKRTSSSSSSRRDDANRDDGDTRSVVSDGKSGGSESTSTGKEKPRSKEKERDKDSTPKKSGWALLGGLIGAASASKSDLSSSRKSETGEKRRKGGEEKERKKRSSKSGKSVDDEDGKRSRSASQSSSAAVLARSREESVDEAFMSADENGHLNARDVNMGAGEDAAESFLATRPELPTATNTEPTATESVKEETGSGNGIGIAIGDSGLPTPAQTQVELGTESERHARARVPLPPPQSSATRDLEPASGSAVGTETSEAEQAQADLLISTPRQRRLSNLRTTDLGSSPSINSPARLGRFPVSPGIIRTGSVGSPPTSFPTATSASSSSPLTTPRTRQGRPSSTDFRSGKEFRPLYLVERHSATKTQNRLVGEEGKGEEEEETFPSLPSSKTSSAHPSLENLRGEYSDGDVDASPQQSQSREAGRRYSWSDTPHKARARSPGDQEFLDSGDVTPTQESFPVGVGRKEKPKYEFHSPSELLEDPARHQNPEGKVPESTDEMVGSPLPSALGTETERSSSPVVEKAQEVEESRSQSRSRSRSASAKDIALGLGLGAGLVGVGVVAGAFDSGSELKGKDEDKEEEFTVQPLGKRKGKKDKKDKKGSKKGRTLDLGGDDGVALETEFQAKAATTLETRQQVDDEKVQTQMQTGDVDVDLDDLPSIQDPTKTAEPEHSSVNEPEDEWAVPSKKSKKSEKGKDKDKDKSGSGGGSDRRDSLPLLTTTETKAESAPTEKDLEGDQQARFDPSLTEPALKDTADARALTFPTLVPVDATDSTAYLDEGTSHASFPFDAPPVRNEAGSVDRDQVPASASAIETAFEAARAARGLPDGVSRESAMDGLVAAPVTTGIQPVDIRDITEADNEKNPFGDDYEIGTSTFRTIPGSFGHQEHSREENFEIAPDEMMPIQDEDRGELLPTIVEESPERSDGSKESEQLGAQAEPETPSEPLHEVAWAPPSMKGKKKSRTFEAAETETSAPEPETGAATQTQTPAVVVDEPVAEETRGLIVPSVTAGTGAEAESGAVAEAEWIVREAQEPAAVPSESVVAVESEPPLEAALPTEGEIAWAPPGKKSKKDKKLKKKGKGTNDFEVEEQDKGEQLTGIEGESRTRDIQTDIQREESAGDVVAGETAGAAKITEEPVLEPAEDDWAVPAKKSKKDKKTKKKSLAFEDIEPASQSLEEAAAAPEVPGGDEKSPETQESVQPTDGPEEIEAIEGLKMAEEPATFEEPIEEEWAVPVKKSKKDKKSKRKSMAFDDAELEPQILEAAAPEVIDGDDHSRDIQESLRPNDAAEGISAVEEPKVAEAPKTAEESTIAEEPRTVEEPMVIEESIKDEWAVPVKKLKKDKKAKKKSIAFDDFEAESESPATKSQTPADEESHDVQETAPDKEKPEQPPLAEESERAKEPVEDEWAPTIKKSKKDKKSKKKSAVFDTFDSESPATGSQTPADEESRDMQETAPVSEELEQLPPAEEPKRTEEPAEDEWTVPAKKSKKSKKSKRETLDFNSAEPTETSIPASESRDIVDREESSYLVTEEPEELPATEPVEEEWAAPAKKSKKDKKSKRKTLDFESVEPTETSTPTSESRDIDNNVSSDPIAASTAVLAAGALAGLAGASLLSEDKEKPVEDDEGAPTPSKKSKKDKKSKKKGMAFSLGDQEDETSLTDTPELEHEVEGLRAGTAGEQIGLIEEPVAVDYLERSPAFAEKPSAEPAEGPAQDVGVDREAPVQEDETEMPTKKSKKDKKSKKKGGLLDEIQPAEETHQRKRTPDSDDVDQPSRTIIEQNFPVAPAAMHVDDVTGHYFGMLRDHQPAPGAPDNRAAQTSREAAQDVIAPADESHGAEEAKVEYSAAVPQSSEFDDRDTPTLASSNPAHDFPVAAKVTHIDDVVGFHYGMLKNYKPDTPGARGSKEIAEQMLPAVSEAVATSMPDDPGQDEWAVPVKKSKKNKNKKRQSLFEEEQPDAESALPEVSQREVPEDALVTDEPRELTVSDAALDEQLVETDAAATMSPATNEEDLYPVISKKSKTDKKKNRQSVFEDEQPDAELRLPEASQKDFADDTFLIDEPRELTVPNTTVENQLVGTGSAPAAEHVEPLVANEEDLYPVMSKKSKKEKKKKRQSEFEEEQPHGGFMPPEASHKDVVDDTLMTDEPRGLSISNPAPVDQPMEIDPAAVTELTKPSATNDEDLYPVISKKSKKDKKKRQSTFDDFEEPSTEQSKDVSEGDAALPIAAGVGVAALGAGILASNRDADTGEVTRPETSALEDDFAPSSPKKSKKEKKKRRQPTFDDFNEEETASPAPEESRDINSDDVAPLADVVDTTLPSEMPQEVVESPAAVEEQPIDFNMKKSKKDKKNKRQSTFDDFDDEQTASSAPEQPEAVITDDVVPPADFVDTAVPSETPEEFIETPAEVEEQPFEISTKKLKKGKKAKRGSTFENFDTAPTTSADDLSVSAPLAETKPVPEGLRDIDETMVSAEDENFVKSGKKSKKEKKTKRGSTFDNFDIAPSTSADSVGITAPVAELGDVLDGQRDDVGSTALAEDDTFAMPGKKSKKDKKKQRHSVLDDVEMKEPESFATSEPPFNDPSVEADTAPETRELEVSLPKTQASGLGDDGWPIEQLAAQATPVEEEEWAVPTKKSKKDKKKKKSPLSWADGEDFTSQPTGSSTPGEPAEARDIEMQEPALRGEEMAIKSDAQPAIVPDFISTIAAQPDDAESHVMSHQKLQSESIPGGWDQKEEETIVDEPMVDEPAQLLDEPSQLVVEPSKLVNEPMEAVYLPEDRDISPGQQEVGQVPEEEEMKYVLKKGKKGKKDKKDKKGEESRKSEAYSEEPETREVEESQIEAAPESLEQAQVENVDDKPIEEAAPEDERGFASKKSKKDKKGKKIKTYVEGEVAIPEVLALPDPSQESTSRDLGEDDAWAVPAKKSKKDKKSKTASTRDMADEERPAESLAFPLNDPDHVDDIAGHYHGMLRDYQPAQGAPDNKPLVASRDIVSEPSIPHIDDVAGHYYGMLREYQPADGAPDNKPRNISRNPEYAQRAERVPSPVSDEETRRARRARRKASPVYSGEEPEDLPGNRSLTPPADHDDMMTTALGVAAGLGLTGAAASAASTRAGASDARSIDRAQAAVPTAQAPGWSFAKINAPGDVHQAQRDSGVQFADSPTLPLEQFDSHNRDSGYVKSPANRESWEDSPRDTRMLDTSNRPPRPQSPTSSSEGLSGKRSKRTSRDMEASFNRREPSPVLSTSKDRSSKLFTSPLSNRVEGLGETPRLDTGHLVEPTTDIQRSPSIHGHHRSREELRARSPASSESRHVAETHHEQSMVTAPEPHRSVYGPYPTQEGHERGFSPPKTPLRTISEHSQDTSPSLRRQRDMSDFGEGHPRKPMQHQESGRNLRDAAGIAGGAAIGALAAHELSRDDQPATRAKSLGKSKANTKSSRSLRRATFDPDVVPSSSTHDPFEGKGKEVARDMSDVYDGHGEYPGSPMSPTRPPSMRKRQSMQQIKDLETRLDQLAAENRTLAEAKIIAERHLEDIQLEQHKSGYAGQEAIATANLQLREKDEAIGRLQQELEGIRQDHARLCDVNAGLSDAHENLRMEHEQRYSQLEDLHAEAHDSWQESSRELDKLQGQHTELSGGMEHIVQREIDTALAEKNIEIERLRSDLETAKEKINELEQQILSGAGDDILTFRDEDYFENACQSLCQHVQQWVLRFSKFSDALVCRTTQQIRDEKLVDRFDLAILDGSDVDVYLGDRIKRRDVFMSVVMTMIFEYIFTRYLFGMDREQRQTLKKLEKNLSEVGERGAVHQWRAMTLTLLAKREAFKASRENDTEAVVMQVYDTLAKFLPPPQNLQAQVQESLRNVMRTAADLSIEMRTQKAEYIMLPPLQPEYDTNGDLTRKVYFNASLMNERSGETSSNNELEAQQAVVRMVLFPLVVKKGNDDGEGEEEIVVCPAQVLVARPDRKSKANSGRVVSAQSDRMSVDQMSRANASRHSLAPSTMDMSNVI